MKHVHKLMLGATAFAGALGGLAFWGVKRAEAKSGVNKAVLNNPPPQNAKVFPGGLIYPAATMPVLGKAITLKAVQTGAMNQGTVVWVQTPVSGHYPDGTSDSNRPAIVVRDNTGEEWYAKAG